MGRRITSLKESPCIKCKNNSKCDKKIKGKESFIEIKNTVFGNADFDYHNCPLWIALNAPEMVEVDE